MFVEVLSKRTKNAFPVEKSWAHAACRARARAPLAACAQSRCAYTPLEYHLGSTMTSAASLQRLRKRSDQRGRHALISVATKKEGQRSCDLVARRRGLSFHHARGLIRAVRRSRTCTWPRSVGDPKLTSSSTRGASARTTILHRNAYNAGSATCTAHSCSERQARPTSTRCTRAYDSRG